MIIWLNIKKKAMVNIDDILANVKDNKDANDKPKDTIVGNIIKVGTIFKLLGSLTWSSMPNISGRISSLFPKTTPSASAPEKSASDVSDVSNVSTDFLKIF